MTEYLPYDAPRVVSACDGLLVYLGTSDRDLLPAAPGVTRRRVRPDEILVRSVIANTGKIREMLRYARRMLPLGDRIRLMAYFEEAGDVTPVGAASAMRESHEAVGAVVALALQRVVWIDWREWRLSPDSRVEAVR